jgi:hypothetical protein
MGCARAKSRYHRSFELIEESVRGQRGVLCSSAHHVVVQRSSCYRTPRNDAVCRGATVVSTSAFSRLTNSSPCPLSLCFTFNIIWYRFSIISREHGYISTTFSLDLFFASAALSSKIRKHVPNGNDGRQQAYKSDASKEAY